MDSIAQLIAELEVDPWRANKGFSPDLEEAHKVMFARDASSEDKKNVLNGWLQKYQPCFFGRIVASLKLINYCLLTEDDVAKGDEFVRDKIQAARIQWTREGYNGEKSGFVILLLSEKIARALPNAKMEQLAKRIASYYLLTEVEPDAIFTDEVFLEKPGHQRTTWRWQAGVNYFCAQGDQRWWADHRIPAGVGFSTNSVGHLVKSAKLIKLMDDMNVALAAPSESLQASNTDTLEKALSLAMRTIANASEAVSGKATNLLPLPRDRSQLPVQECPYHLASNLQNSNYCEYQGFYHTDYTLPSEYFRPDVERPSDIQSKTLDFTYLFWNSIENSAFTTMGEGQQIRSHDLAHGPEQHLSLRARLGKRLRSVEETIVIDENERLLHALNGE